MNFGKAYSAMEMGAAMRRTVWGDPTIALRLQKPDAHSLMTVQYTYLANDTERMPYVPSFADLASDDWEYVSAAATTEPTESKE